MEFNNKKLTRTAMFIQYMISILLAAFLIGLANRIIWDMDERDDRPVLSSYEFETEIHKYRRLKDAVQDSIFEISRLKDNLQLNLDLAQTTLRQERASFKSWTSTRTATQLSDIDSELRTRNRTMDSINKAIQSYEKEKTGYTTTVKDLSFQMSEHQKAVDREMLEASILYTAAVRSYELSVFLKRLLFVLPVLALGIWMLVKKRKHTYWALFRGFVFFSFYAFFVGLLPYLPTYGGYVRYSIGILLSIFLGIYAIRSLQDFIKRKKEELKKSTQERSKQIKLEVAEKALESHMCPSCGKDYLINEIHQSGGKKGTGGTLKATTYCRHCGLQLFADCKTCETKNYAHLPHCYSCGDYMTVRGNQSTDAQRE